MARNLQKPVRVPRRHLIQVGSLGAVGLSLPDILRAAETNGVDTARAKRCILFFYQTLGLDPETMIHDQFNRPHKLSLGIPIDALFA